MEGVFNPAPFSAGLMLLFAIWFYKGLHDDKKNREYHASDEYKAEIQKVVTVRDNLENMRLRMQAWREEMQDLDEMLTVAVRYSVKTHKPNSQGLVEPPELVEEPEPKQVTDSNVIKDAVSAIVGLGFKKAEAKKLIQSLCEHTKFDNVEDIVRVVLTK